jgi:phage tail P2-like protein
LPWLAWAFSVDAWDPTWTDAQKRSVIKNSLYIHKHKGTIGAIERALSSIGYSLTIREWFNMVPVGDPYTFEIVVGTTGIAVTDDIYATVERIVMDAKNVRSHLSRLAVSTDVLGNIFVGSVVCDGSDAQVLPYFPGELEVLNSIFVLSLSGFGDTVHVAPNNDIAFYNGAHTYNGAVSY